MHMHVHNELHGLMNWIVYGLGLIGSSCYLVGQPDVTRLQSQLIWLIRRDLSPKETPSSRCTEPKALSSRLIRRDTSLIESHQVVGRRRSRSSCRERR